MAFFLYFFFLLASFASACDRCVHQTKAAYFSDGAAPSSGACGYGSLELELSGGHLAVGVPSLYKNGAGCDACFQIRCKSSSLCTKSGALCFCTFEFGSSQILKFCCLILSSQSHRPNTVYRMERCPQDYCHSMKNQTGLPKCITKRSFVVNGRN